MTTTGAGRTVVRTSESPSRFGERLRDWRRQLGLSQMKLALESGVSTRHLSFLETGRAQPSEEMVLRLCETMDLPLRERNVLLAAAGFGSLYRETALEAPEMQTLCRILTTLVERHDPYPAFLLDHCWNVLFANTAVSRCFAPFARDAPVWRAEPLNLLRLTLDPEGLRPSLLNWDVVASEAFARVRREEAFSRSESGLRALVREFESDPDVNQRPAGRSREFVPEVVLPLHLKSKDLELRLFSTVTTVGVPGDITLEGLRIEAFVPVDDASDDALRRLSSASV